MKNKCIGVILICVLILVGLSSSSYSFSSSVNKPESLNYRLQSVYIENTTYSIVVTQPFIQDFVQNLVGNLFQVTSIVKGAQDPHSFTPTVKDTLIASSANIFMYFGVADIDGWTTGIISTLPSSVNVVKLIDLAKDGLFDPFIGSGELNPHLWMWPAFVNNTFIQRIYNALVQYDPIHTEIYSKNLIKYRLQLKVLMESVNGNSTLLKNYEFVEYHAAYFYLLHEMNLTRLGTVEKIEDQEPSVVHFTNITNIIRDEVKRGKTVIIVQSLEIPPDTAWQIARDTGAKIAYVASLLGNYKTINFINYIQMINYDLFSLTHPQDAPIATPGFEGISIIFFLFTITVIFRKK